MRYFKNIIHTGFESTLKSLGYTSFKKLFFRETGRSLSNSISSVALDPIRVLLLWIQLLKQTNCITGQFTDKKLGKEGGSLVCQTHVAE